MKPVFYCYHHLWKLIDVIYPPTCAGCGKSGYRLCDACIKKIRNPGEPICQICGIPIPVPGICNVCITLNRTGFHLRSWGIFEGPLRNAIHHLKYNSDIGVVEIFSCLMAQYLERLDWQYDMIVPVPLTPQRKKERGFNQSALLGRLIALETGKPFSAKGLSRIRHTVSQTRLNAVERRQNVANAFEAHPQYVKNKRIVLVDDLATTCATLESCTEALINAGARTVFSFTLARTL